MKNRILNIVFFVALASVAVFLYNKYRIAPKVKFQALVLTDLNGQAVSLQKIQSRKLFVNFFATWCPPCVAEIPSLEKAQRLLLADNIRFVMISDEPIEKLKMFKERNQVSLLLLHSETKLKDVDVVTIPTSYLLNNQMEIELKHVGEEDWSSEAWLKKLR